MGQIAAPFSKVRSFLWPIYRNELKKFIPMLLMGFFISINYHLLKLLKDPLVVTVNQSGAETIPFLKVWAMLPMAILMTYLFTTLTRHLRREWVFYLLITFFTLFYILFSFVLYPLRDVIHPHTWANQLQVFLPRGLQGLVDVFRNWSISLFYVMSEMWSAIILTVLFWSFINEITKVNEARRFYALIAIGVNLAGSLTGLFSYIASQLPYSHSLPGESRFEQFLIICTCLLTFSSICTLLLFYWMQRHVLTDPANYHPEARQQALEKRKNISLTESFRYLARSRYVLYIAAIVVSYNVVINLTEVAWKDQLLQQHADPSEYAAYFSEVAMITGFLACLTAFISGYFIRRFGWTFSALIPPVIFLVTTIGFFSFLIFGEMMQDVLWNLLHTTPLIIAVLFGSTQNILGRVSKYTLFDATKELAFTPLASDEKVNAKAVIDGIGSRFGKSGGALVYQVLLFIYGGIQGTSGAVALLIFFFIALWIINVKMLGKQVEPLIAQRELQKT